MKKRLLTIILAFGSVALFAQSKIGSNPGTLQSGQLLQLEAQGNRAGLKIAEVALTGTNDATTVKLPSDQTKAKGTLIWNTATVGGGNAVSPGFYVWTGTAWERVNTGVTPGNISGVSNTSSANSLSTTVNGLTGSAVPIINSNSLTASGGNLISNVNGVSSSVSLGTVLNSGTTVSNTVTSPNSLTTTVNGVTGSSVSMVTGVSNSSSTNTLTTTVNGVTGSGVNIINSNALTSSGGNLVSTVNGVSSSVAVSSLLSSATTVSNASSTNSLTTTVNGVTGTAVNIINGNTLTAASNAITSTVNGVTATLTPTAGGTITESLGFDSNGDLVSQATSSLNVPTFYTSNGSFDNRQVQITNGGTFYLIGQNSSVANSGTNTNANFRIQGVSNTNGLDIGNTNSAPYLQSNNINDLSSSLPLLLNPNGGNVGIGTTSPSQALDVTGNVRLSGALMPGGAAGTTGQILTSAGAGAAPTWASASSLPVTVSNTSSTNSLTTTVNGVTGAAVNIINSNNLTAASNAITSTVNGVTATLTPTAGGTVTENLGFNAAGNLVRQTVSAANTPNIYTTDGTISGDRGVTLTGGVLYLNGRNLAIANSGGATNANLRVQGASNNNVLDFGNTTAAPYIQSSDRTNLATSLNLLLNPNGGNVGIANASPSERLDVSGNVRFSGALMPGNAAGTAGQVLTSAGAGAAPTWSTVSTSNIYSANGTLSSNRTVNMGGNSLSFLSNAAGNSALLSIGRTAGEMDMGVAGGSSSGLNGTVAGDTWMKSGANLFLGVSGTGALNLVTGASGGATRMSINSSGNVGIGTTSPATTLDVAGTGSFSGRVTVFANSGQPPTSGTTNNAAAFRVGASNGDGNVLDMGTFTNNGVAAYLQSTDRSLGYTNNYALLLNPNGGSVGIGTANPSERLHVAGNVRFSGALMPNNAAGTSGQVLTSAGAGSAPTWTSLSATNTPNIYTTNGTLTAARTITTNGNPLNIWAGSTNNAYVTFGRTASEMDMGISGGSGNGLSPTVAGDAWVKSTTNLFVGTAGSGSFHVATGTPTQATRLFINSTGNVGIGTTSPGQILDVNGVVKATQLTNGSALVGTTNSTPAADLGIFNQTGSWNRYVTSSSNHQWYVDGAAGNNFYGSTPVMTLTAAGRLGLGLTSPTVRVQVAAGNIAATNGNNNTSEITNGTGNTTGVLLEQNGRISAEGSSSTVIISKSGNAWLTATPFVEFMSNGATLAGIYSNAGRSAVSYNTTSDVRLKENIIPTHLGLADVNNIKVYDYNFKADQDKTPQVGFLAQELYKIYPQAVTVGGDDPKKNPWSVDYGKLTPLLVKAIQEQQVQIEALKKEIENLKNK